jgi:hypothetical protein
MNYLLKFDLFKTDKKWRRAVDAYGKITPLVLGGIEFVEREIIDRGFLNKYIKDTTGSLIQFYIDEKAFYTSVMRYADAAALTKRFRDGAEAGLTEFELLKFVFENVGNIKFYEVSIENGHKVIEKLGKFTAVLDRFPAAVTSIIPSPDSLANNAALITASAASVVSASAAAVASTTTAVVSFTAKEASQLGNWAESYVSNAYNAAAEIFSRYVFKIWDILRRNPKMTMFGGITGAALMLYVFSRYFAGTAAGSVQVYNDDNSEQLRVEEVNEIPDSDLSAEDSDNSLSDDDSDRSFGEDSGSSRTDDDSEIGSLGEDSNSSRSDDDSEIGSLGEDSDSSRSDDDSVIESFEEDLNSELSEDDLEIGQLWEEADSALSGNDSDKAPASESIIKESDSSVQEKTIDAVCNAIAAKNIDEAKLLLNAIKEQYSPDELEDAYSIVARHAIFYSSQEILQDLVKEPQFNPRDYLSDVSAAKYNTPLIKFAAHLGQLDAFKLLFEGIQSSKNDKHSDNDRDQITGVIKIAAENKDMALIGYLQSKQENLTTEQQKLIDEYAKRLSTYLSAGISEASSSSSSSSNSVGFKIKEVLRHKFLNSSVQESMRGNVSNVKEQDTSSHKERKRLA